MRIEPFQPFHLDRLELQPDQADIDRELFDKYGGALAMAGPAFTVFDGDVPVGCMGALEHHAKRAELWALLSGKQMKFITRAVRGWLLQSGYPRIDAVVSVKFALGHKWVRMLGFEQEGPERLAYMANGDAAITYVRLA